MANGKKRNIFIYWLGFWSSAWGRYKARLGLLMLIIRSKKNCTFCQVFDLIFMIVKSWFELSWIANWLKSEDCLEKIYIHSQWCFLFYRKGRYSSCMLRRNDGYKKCLDDKWLCHHQRMCMSYAFDKFILLSIFFLIIFLEEQLSGTQQ